MDKIITVESHFIQQFYKELLKQIICFDIMSSGGQEVFTTGVAYPVQPWMYCPFKDGKITLSENEANWNFIQYLNRMCVERAFGILKGRWRMIIKRCEVSLRNISDIIATCVVLHNLCIVNKEGIEEDWIVVAENKLSRMIGEGELREGNELRSERAGIVEVKRRMLCTKDATIADEVNNEEI